MIIVTGGAGFIGSNIVKTLNRQGRSDILIVDDLKTASTTKTFVDSNSSTTSTRTIFSKPSRATSSTALTSTLFP